MICSTSSAERRRDFRPCTLMMVQNEHRNGQPRPASKLVSLPPVRLICAAGRIGKWRPSKRRQIVHVVVQRLQRRRSRHRAEPASKRPSASPANSEMPRSMASFSSGVSSGSMDRQPET